MGAEATSTKLTEPSRVGLSSPLPDPEEVRETELQILHAYGVGVDVHSRFIQVALMYQVEGAVKLVEWETPVSYDALLRARDAVLEKLRQVGQSVPEDELRYCLESTGTYHFPIYRAFGGCPAVVNPLLANPSRRKTDVLDARLLARHSITGVWPETYLPTDEVQALRLALGARKRFVRDRTRGANSIQSMLRMFGWTGSAGARVGDRKVRRAIESVIAGKVVLEGVLEPLPVGVRMVLGNVLDTWRASDRCVKEVTIAIRDMGRLVTWRFGSNGARIPGKEALSLLQTIEGVGPLLAVSWLAWIVNLRRFEVNVRKVNAYSGTDPSLKVSAGKATAFSKRKGCVHLHDVLLQASRNVVARRLGKLGRWGYSLARRPGKGSYRKAVGAVARRLVGFLFHVQRTGEAFSDEKYSFWAAPDVPDVSVLDAFSAKTAARLFRAHVSTTAQCAVHESEGWVRVTGIGDVTKKEVAKWIREHKNPIKPVNN